ncbi:MAG: phenylalanyl-tRNA synthetase alpha chain [Candidatus Dependentiae bacterium]|nr:phenylalanyl-tRNA synthetase alpha chain [Candidatus Dependentiae bacterium]
MNTLQEHIVTQTLLWQQELAAVNNHQQLEEIRIKFLGKKGSIQALFEQLGSCSLDEKRICGPLLNTLKKECEAKIQEKKLLLAAASSYTTKSFDVTAYTPGQIEGNLHPYTHFITEVQNIFLSMGFELLDGPEVETDYHNFTALNIPGDHPARDMYDTFWLNSPGMLMRTHTSTVQMRAMKEKKLPLAGICTGRVFRHEAVDASHDHTFFQCEGILIDKKVTLAHLFGVIEEFLRTLFGSDTLAIRTRPGFFPFVEPGVEIDMQCPFCTTGCSTCKKTRWIEVFPGGMIHPNVLREAGIDPTEYSGFAFGFGLTRLAMLRYGIKDIRMLSNGKVQFLKHFT